MTKSQIHDRAIEVSRKYRACEVELIDVLQEVDRHNVFLHYGSNSLFAYATDRMGLSQEVAAIYISVARKALEVPALKREIREGRISVTKARRIAPVLKPSNQKHWLELARSSSKQKLEREVALANPKEAVRDKLNFTANPVNDVTLKRNIPIVQFQAGVSEALMLKIRHAQDLISQKRQASVGLDEVLSVLVDSYLKREDPVEKAQRSKIKGEKIKRESVEHENSEGNTRGKETSTQSLPVQCPGTISEMRASIYRKPFSAKEKHAVYLKFKGRCSFESHGKQCGNRRFLQIHHKIPVSHGGSNDPNNLELLCSGHHKAKHLRNLDHRQKHDHDHDHDHDRH